MIETIEIGRTISLEELPLVENLAARDARQMAKELEAGDSRYLVDLYYQIQEYRKATGNQQRAAAKSDEPSRAVQYVYNQMTTTESSIKKLMDAYTDLSVPGQWAKSQYGIGPVITAGLLSHIDITKAPTAGHIWSFAGLDPTKEWKKGQKRPFNAKLKTLCWKVGDSFVKFHNREECFYGHLYEQRKAYEVNRDVTGGNMAAAMKKVVDGSVDRVRDAKTKAYLTELYTSGHLSDAQLDMRARRWTVKLFLAHLQHVLYEDYYHEKPPNPYVIEHMGHTDIIGPPNWPMK